MIIVVTVLGPLALSTMVPEGSGLFAATISNGQWATIWLMTIVGMVFLWSTVFMLWMTLKKREMPLHFRTVSVAEDALERQMFIDDQVCRKNKDGSRRKPNLPRDRLYEWPWWSIGHGLVTTGPRRVLAPPLVKGGGGEIIWQNFWWVTVVMVFVPICVILPLAIEGSQVFSTFERVPGLTRTALLVLLGLPAMWFAFYGGRLFWGVFPARLKAVAGHRISVLFFGVGFVLPFGVLLPIDEQNRALNATVETSMQT